MKCTQCGKILPITRILQPTGDGVQCIYCHAVIPSETIAWSDGKFHFSIIGYVVSGSCKVSPRVLMKEQTANVLDIKKIRSRAIKNIRREPNLRCVAGEFEIKDSDIAVELLVENQ